MEACGGVKEQYISNKENKEMKGLQVYLPGFYAVCLFVSPVYAMDSDVLSSENRQANFTAQESAIAVSAHIGAGYLSGESNELVYDPFSGQKISELQWDLDEVYMFNAGAAIAPLSWLTISADFWINLNKGNGAMDDYDYLAAGYSGYSHWSHHEDTDLSSGYMFDINAAFTFYRAGETSFSGLVGYKHDNWEWESYGGSYVYSTTYLHDTVGSFPAGEKVITYNQWFDVPYIGLGFESAAGRMFFKGRIIASPLVSAGDEDIHHLRNLRFEGDFDYSSMVGIDLGLGYSFTPNLALTAAFKYQKYEEADGDTLITDLSTGAQQHVSGDAAGVDHSSSMVSVGLQYRF